MITNIPLKIKPLFLGMIFRFDFSVFIHIIINQIPEFQYFSSNLNFINNQTFPGLPIPTQDKNFMTTVSVNTPNEKKIRMAIPEFQSLES